jgi:hypothetical protein
LILALAGIHALLKSVEERMGRGVGAGEPIEVEHA